MDLFLAVYPGMVLFKLQMSLRKKIALSAALGLGSMYGNFLTSFEFWGLTACSILVRLQLQWSNVRRSKVWRTRQIQLVSALSHVPL